MRIRFRRQTLASYFVLIAACLPSTRADAGIAVEYDPANEFEAFIVNTSTSPVELDAYTITSPINGLVPLEWNSIDAQADANSVAVEAVLGDMSSSFDEFLSTPAELTEANFTGFGLWQTGTRFSIGHPFGRSGSALSVAETAELTFLVRGNTMVMNGGIATAPEPNQTLIGLLMMLGFAWRRYCRQRDT